MVWTKNHSDFLKKAFASYWQGSIKKQSMKSEKRNEIQPSATVYFIEALAYEHSGDHNSALTLLQQSTRAR